MSKRILGIPEDDEYDYEFMVVKEKEDHFEWVSNHENWDEADKASKECEGANVIVHNLRIAHKEKRKALKND